MPEIGGSIKSDPGIGHNGGVSGEVQGYVERIERIDEEIKGLRKDRTDVLKQAAAATGFSETAFANILRERTKAKSVVHATYTDMDAIRRALGMRDPLLPIDEEPPEPPRPPAADSFCLLGEALHELHLGPALDALDFGQRDPQPEPVCPIDDLTDAAA